MTRLPVPGSDSGGWGTVLNNFLSVSLIGGTTDSTTGGQLGTVVINGTATMNNYPFLLNGNSADIYLNTSEIYGGSVGGSFYTIIDDSGSNALISPGTGGTITTIATSGTSTYVGGTVFHQSSTIGSTNIYGGSSNFITSNGTTTIVGGTVTNVTLNVTGLATATGFSGSTAGFTGLATAAGLVGGTGTAGIWGVGTSSTTSGTVLNFSSTATSGTTTIVGGTVTNVTLNVTGLATATGFSGSTAGFTGLATAQSFVGTAGSFSHYYSVTSPTTILAGNGGITLSASAITGNDVRGTFTFTPSTTFTAGSAAKIVFGTAYSTTPGIMIYPGNSAAGSVGVVSFYATALAGTAFSVNLASGTVQAVAYVFNYMIIG